MATKKKGPTHQQVMDELCCLLGREVKLADVEVKPKPKPKKIQLREVRDCCGCGCSFMYYEDPETMDQYTKDQANKMVSAGTAFFRDQRDVE